MLGLEKKHVFSTLQFGTSSFITTINTSVYITFLCQLINYGISCIGVVIFSNMLVTKTMGIKGWNVKVILHLQDYQGLITIKSINMNINNI